MARRVVQRLFIGRLRCWFYSRISLSIDPRNPRCCVSSIPCTGLEGAQKPRRPELKKIYFINIHSLKIGSTVSFTNFFFNFFMSKNSKNLKNYQNFFKRVGFDGFLHSYRDKLYSNFNRHFRFKLYSHASFTFPTAYADAARGLCVTKANSPR